MFSQYRLACDQANFRSCLLLLYFRNTAVVPNGEALSLAFYPKEALIGHYPFLAQKDTVASQLCTDRMVGRDEIRAPLKMSAWDAIWSLTGGTSFLPS